MGRTLWENWVLGPHDPEARSPVGAFFWWLVCSDAWEFVFLSYILFNAVLKMTDLRIQVPTKHPLRLVTLPGRIFTGVHLDGYQPR
jgi:hypothetical protein